MAQHPEPPRMAIVLVELHPGKLSVALRFDQSHTVQLLEDWEDLPPGKAASIAARIIQGQISAKTVADKPYREVTLPAEYWRKVDGGPR